jgi:hypothetical protein
MILLAGLPALCAVLGKKRLNGTSQDNDRICERLRRESPALLRDGAHRRIDDREHLARL